MSDLSAAIDAAWEKRDQLGVTTKGAERDAVEAALDGLDSGACASPRRSTANGRCISG